MRQVVYTMFTGNNRPSFLLWWKEHLAKHRKDSRYYETDCRLFKNPNFPSLLWIGKNLEIYTAPEQHVKIPMLNLWMSWENLCPNLSYTVENKMDNSHERRWSHLKLTINDWDFPFPKILRICQWIRKNIFHCGKCNKPIKLISECVRLKIKI